MDVWSASRPGSFTPRERAPGTPWIGGWMGPRADLDAVVKRKIPSPPPGTEPNRNVTRSKSETDLVDKVECSLKYLYYKL